MGKTHDYENETVFNGKLLQEKDISHKIYHINIHKYNNISNII